ncbi:hypothetical protein REJ26_001982 [Providencia stuartii]|uniref:hypothetical protein n=1 Tax=Providencia sp. 2023EL-00965 TaxID=3084975 RepID=UPI0027F5B32E|nr:hypothetical protein [Providencia sp. 2023EL-00965]ELR5300215.1 hypothetical protein [Providencia stuartii]MDW7589292.1 hypothetical protein [Providencia sp. 2023EL-00965]
MKKILNSLETIAYKLNEILQQKSKRKISNDMIALHEEFSSLYKDVREKHGELSESMEEILYELLMDIRWGRETSVMDKINEEKQKY